MARIRYPCRCVEMPPESDLGDVQGTGEGSQGRGGERGPEQRHGYVQCRSLGRAKFERKGEVKSGRRGGIMGGIES